MDDSNAMTIEFLRARLLSERSVSKTARQRAEELTIRVAELEKQLRIVSLQRKKAEKATADVLAILEMQGVSDISEAYYSSSDQDVTPHKVKVSNDSKKGAESSFGSIQAENESEEFSATELDSSTVFGRSLSWKGRKDPSRSLEKFKDTSIRRRSSLVSMGSPSKHRAGKSCRQIRHRENRLEAAELANGHSKVDDSYSETCHNLTEMGPEVSDEDHKLQDKMVPHNGPVLVLSENEGNMVNNVLGSNKDVGEKDMERALEHQAQLIGQYEAMEKAQREWEEKFRENNSSTPDSCDPGNHSDITEERDEIKSQAPYPRLTVTVEAVDAQLGTEDASSCNKFSGTQPRSFHQSSRSEVDSLQSRKSATPVDNSLNQELAYPILNSKQESMESDNNIRSQITQNDVSRYHNSPGKQPSHGFSPSVSNASHEAKLFGNHTDHKALVPHGKVGAVGGVLDSLKQAKLLLQTKMMTVPIVEGELIQKPIQPSFLHNDAGGKMDIPGGFPGLFRLPTDFALDASKANLVGSEVRLGLTGFYPERGVSLPADDRSLSSRYLEGGQSLYGDDRYVSSAFMEVGSRISSPNPGFDPYLNHPMHGSFLTHPPYRPHLETMPRMLPNEGFLTTFSGSTARTSHTDEFLFHDGYGRQSMYG